VVASIDLAVEGHSEIAQAWSDPKGSRGEGAVLLPGGHLLVAKEKKPAAFIEFGPPHSRSRGLLRGGALEPRVLCHGVRRHTYQIASNSPALYSRIWHACSAAA
jgi:hypothetical protein